MARVTAAGLDLVSTPYVQAACWLAGHSAGCVEQAA